MKMQQLIEATQRLDELLAQNGGEITPEIEPLLEAAGTLDERLQWLAEKADQEEAEAERMADLEKAVKERRQAAENRATRLRDFILYSMLQAGVERSNGVRDIKLAKKAPHLGTIEEDKIPPAFFNTSQLFELSQDDLFKVSQIGLWPTKENKKLDRQALLDALKAGETVPGAEIVTNSKRLNIK